MTATVQELSSYFSSIQAKLLGDDGVALLRGGWVPLAIVNASTFECSENGAIYVSATSLKVIGDITSYVQIGTRVKLTDNSTTKYFAVASASYSSPYTTITFIPSTDYALAGGTPTNLYFSQKDDPIGFPAVFNYTPSSFTGFSATPSAAFYLWSITASGWVTVTVYISGLGTSDATSFQLKAPIKAKDMTGAASCAWGCVPWSASDNGAALTTPTQAVIVENTDDIILSASISGAGGLWTNANGKGANFDLRYPAR